MNKQNILMLADHIEALPEEKFDLNHLTHTCGSPSCIAGWAAWFEQGKPEVIYDNAELWDSLRNPIIASAMSFFGIPYTPENSKVWNELFCGGMHRCEISQYDRAQAVRTLRHFAETGNIDWEA